MIYQITAKEYVNLRNINFIRITNEQPLDKNGRLLTRININFMDGTGTAFYLTEEELKELHKVLANYGG